MTNLGRKLVRYLLGGLIIGGFWYLNHSRPAWEEAVRTIVVFSAIMIFLHFRLRRRGVVVHLVPLIGSKAVLVAVAAGVEQAMRHDGVTDAALIVAIGLGVAVCLVGAVAHNYFFTYVGTPSSPAPAQGGPR